MLGYISTQTGLTFLFTICCVPFGELLVELLKQRLLSLNAVMTMIFISVEILYKVYKKINAPQAHLRIAN